MGKTGRSEKRKLISNFKVFKQERNGTCGAASLRMLLYFYGIELSEKHIVETLFRVKPEGGVRPRTIVRITEKLGERYDFKVWANEDRKIKDIRRFIKKGIPVMVEWKTDGVGHYSVAIGIDDEYIYLADPDNGSPDVNKIAISDFKTVWYDCEDELPLRNAEWSYQWMMAIIPKK